MGRFRYFSYVIIAIGLYLLWTLALLPLAAKHTGLCGFCHATREAYRSTFGTPHEDIGCLACHRSPGITGAASSDFRAGRNVKSWIVRRSSGENRVDNDSCLRCHDTVLEGVRRLGDLKMSHRAVNEAGWRCADCHGNTGHALSQPKASLQRPTMDKCFGCHIAKKSLRRCSLCHARGKPDRFPGNPRTLGTLAHTTGWKTRAHGFAETGACPVCHQRRYCKKCHGLDLPHPRETWPNEHGRFAIKDNAVCRPCHDIKKLCDSCHTVQMPHESEFVQKHTRSEDFSVCTKCHERYDCVRCHDNHYRHKQRKRAKMESEANG